MAIKLKESRLKQIIREEYKKIVDERVVDKFTPYTPGDRKQNFSPFFGGDNRTPEERNPSYAQAKKDAQERMRQKKLAQSNATQQPKKLDETEFKNMVKEMVRHAINENTEQDFYNWTMNVLNRRLKKQSFNDVIAFAEKELEYMDNMTHRMSSQERGQAKAYEDFLFKYKNRFNDGSDNPYSEDGKYYQRLETDPT